MEQIRIEQPFILFANCCVDYNGRATSNLKLGYHLIIHKNDGTLLIHGGALCTPLNYQPPQAILKKEHNRLISTRGDETIIITIDEIFSYNELHNWSSKKIDIHKTEKDLRDFIVANIEPILGFKPKETYIEFATPVGNIDILVIDSREIYHIIEVKRGKANLAACSQLERYSNYFIDIMKNVRDYLASPDISTNALAYSEGIKQKWLKIDHSS